MPTKPKPRKAKKRKAVKPVTAWAIVNKRFQPQPPYIMTIVFTNWKPALEEPTEKKIIRVRITPA